MNESQPWLVRPKTIRALRAVFILVLVLSVVSGLFVHQHEAFGIEDSFAFFGWYGFLACVVLFLLAKVLGIFLQRPDDYYDE